VEDDGEPVTLTAASGEAEVPSSCVSVIFVCFLTDEWYKSSTAVFHRICSLLIDEQTTKAIAMCLGSIRRELGISQEVLSATLEITQATYSKQERRADMKVSTLRKAVEAMGGVLHIEARFPDSQDVRELTFQ
jgi:DNA-binding XRE family transcriptional regulator